MKSLQKCHACGKELRGRSDKKYCDYLCRNMYHNQRNGIGTPHYRYINNILKQNYSILRKFYGHDNKNVPMSILEKEGFNFQYFTHTKKVIGGLTCYFCYDLGYLPSESGYFAMVSIHEKHFRQNRYAS